MARIEKCPRCGGDPLLDTRTLITYITCLDCGFRVFDTEQSAAVNRWNHDTNCRDACDIEEEA